MSGVLKNSVCQTSRQNIFADLLAVTFFHIRSATVAAIILAAAVATSTEYAQVNVLQCELLSAAFGLGKDPRPHSLVLVVAIAVALVTRLSARTGARAALFELGIKALALWEWRWRLGTDMSFVSQICVRQYNKSTVSKPACSIF